jgi:hypothetical protein
MQILIYSIHNFMAHKEKANSVCFSLQANYTDRAAATCWRSKSKLFRIKGCHLVNTPGHHMGDYLDFQDRSC